MSDHTDETPEIVTSEVGPDTSDERPTPIPAELPVLPLRDTVLFPNSFMPLAVARESSVRLIDEAIAGGKLIGVFAQRDPALDEPIQADLYEVGTATHIHKMFRLPDGSLRLIVQGPALYQPGARQQQPCARALGLGGRLLGEFPLAFVVRSQRRQGTFREIDARVILLRRRQLPQSRKRFQSGLGVALGTLNPGKAQAEF